MKKGIENITAILKTEVPKLKSQHNVATLEVFGAFVRETQTANSNVDILVSFTKSPSLFRFLELEYFLSELLGVKVDLVMRNSLKPNIGRRILSETQPII